MLASIPIPSTTSVLPECNRILARTQQSEEAIWTPADFIDAAVTIEKDTHQWSKKVDELHTDTASLHSSLVSRVVHVRRSLLEVPRTTVGSAPKPLSVRSMSSAHGQNDPYQHFPVCGEGAAIPQGCDTFGGGDVVMHEPAATTPDVNEALRKVLTRNPKRRKPAERTRSVNGHVARSVVADALACGAPVFRKLLEQPSPERSRPSGERQATPLAPPPPMEPGLWCAGSVAHVTDVQHIGEPRASLSYRGGTATHYHSASHSPVAASCPSLLSQARGFGGDVGGCGGSSSGGSVGAAGHGPDMYANPMMMMDPAAVEKGVEHKRKPLTKKVDKSVSIQANLSDLLTETREFLNPYAASTLKKLPMISKRTTPKKYIGLSTWHKVNAQLLPDPQWICSLATCRGEDDVLASLPSGAFPQGPPKKDLTIKACLALAKDFRQELCAYLGAVDVSEDAGEFASYMDGVWCRLSQDQREMVREAAKKTSMSPSVVMPHNEDGLNNDTNNGDWQPDDDDYNNDNDDDGWNAPQHYPTPDSSLARLGDVGRETQSGIDFPLLPYTETQRKVLDMSIQPMAFEDILCTVVSSSTEHGKSSSLSARDIPRHFLALLCAVTEGKISIDHKEDGTLVYGKPT